MIATGILHEGDPIELIDGILVRKDRSKRGGDPMTHYPPHASAIRALLRLLQPVEKREYFVQSQLPVTLGTTREPEPDLAIIRGRDEDFRKTHPGPGDIAVVVEVSDSSLTYDRTTKQRLYASAGIPIYWIVNLVDNQIEVYEEPQASQGKYARPLEYKKEQTVTLELDSGLKVTIPVSSVLPG
jgi:Uma2 family endonuclease